MAIFATLRPIPQVMLTHHAEWSSHPDENSKPDKQVFKPFGTPETVVNEAPVHTDGMPKTQREPGQKHVNKQS